MRRSALALGAAVVLAMASVGSVSAAGGKGTSFCSNATGGFNPGTANLAHVPPGPGGLPAAVGLFAPVATAFCNPTDDHPSDPHA